MVLEWMGPDRVLYGSDAPPLTSLKPRAIKLIQDLDLPAADRDAIFWGNAARLLKLPLARATPPETIKAASTFCDIRAVGAYAPARVDERPSHP